MKSNCSPFRLCYCAVFFVVLLRITIGWHFFYEGIHKFDPAAEFSAEGFLGVAKGTTAELYYWMLPDLDGTQRIELGKVKDENDEKGEKELDTFIVYENAWKEYFKEYLFKYSAIPLKHKGEATVLINMGTKDFAEWVEKNLPPANADGTKSYKGPDVVEARTIFDRYIALLRMEAADSKDNVQAFLASRERFNEYKRTVRNETAFEQERRWNQMMRNRREAAVWTRSCDELGNSLQSELGRLANPDLAGQKGQIVTAPEKEFFPNPFTKKRMDSMNLAVMLGLSAIGLCMILGFCNRLACLGGAAFLVNVVLTTYPVPGVYPEIPSMVGNFMFVTKDVVELVALLFLATIPAGRWAGLDYFLWHCGGKKIAMKICPFCKCSEEQKL